MKIFFPLCLTILFCWTTPLLAQVDLSAQIAAAKTQLEEKKIKYSTKHIEYHKSALECAALIYQNEDTWDEAYEYAYPALDFIYLKEGENSSIYKNSLKKIPKTIAGVINARIRFAEAKKLHKGFHIYILKRYIDLAKAYLIIGGEYPYDNVIKLYQSVKKSDLEEKDEFYDYVDKMLPKYYTTFLKADMDYRAAKKKGKESEEFAEQLINLTKLSFKHQKNDEFYFDFDVNYQELFDAGEIALANDNQKLYDRIIETINLSEDMERMYTAQKIYIDALRSNTPMNNSLIIKLRQFIDVDLDIYGLHPYFYEDVCTEIYDSIKSKLGEESDYYKNVSAICTLSYDSGMDPEERNLIIEKSATKDVAKAYGSNSEEYAAQLFKLADAHIQAYESFESIDIYMEAIEILEQIDLRNEIVAATNPNSLRSDTIPKVKQYLNTLDSAWKGYIISEININAYKDQDDRTGVALSEAYFMAALSYIYSDVLVDERVAEYIPKAIKVLDKDYKSFALEPLTILFKYNFDSYASDYITLIREELPSQYNFQLLEITEKAAIEEYGINSPEHWNIKAYIADIYFFDNKLKNHAEKALDIYTEALAIMLKEDGTDFEYTTTLERLCYNIYQYDSPWPTSISEKFFERLLDITRNDYSKRIAYAKHLKWYADWHYDNNNFVAAEPLYKEYIKKVSSGTTNQKINYISGLYNIARIYRKTGRYQSATNTYERALTFLKTNPDDYLEIKIKNDLGLLYQQYGIYASADTYFEEALERLLTLDDSEKGRFKSKKAALLYIKTMRRIGRLAFDLEDYAKAQDYYQMVRDFEDESEYVSFFRDYSLQRDLALLYEQLGEDEKAKRYFKLVLKQLDDYDELAEIMVSFAHFYQRQKKDSLAKDLYIKALSLDTRAIRLNYPNLSEEERLLFLKPINKRINNFLDFVSQNPNDSTLLIEGLNAHLMIKGLALENTNNIKDAIVNSENVLLNEWNNELLLLRKKMSKAATLSPEALIKKNINIKKLAEDIKNLEKKLSRESKALRNAFDKQNKELQYTQLKEILNPNEAAIDFWTIDQVDEYGDFSTTYYGVIITKEQQQPILVKLASELDISYVLDNEVAPNSINYITDELESHYLYQLIWQPMLPYLDTIYSLHICPTGLLSKVSFGPLLRYDNQRKRIMDKWELHYYSSLRDLLRETTPSTSKKIALIGGVHFDLNQEQLLQVAATRKLTKKSKQKLLAPPSNTNYSTTTEEFGYLPGTLQEVKSIANLFEVFDWNITTLTGIEALEENVDTIDLSSPDILHIATHGFFFSANSGSEEDDLLDAKNKAFSVENTIASNKDPLLRSGLAMTGINMIWKDGKQIEGLEDGILFAKEVAGMNLFETELVVLSACETGRGDIDNNEGIMGLQRAFKTAGAHKLIISLWKVPDQQTSELMQQFYSNYLTSNDVHFSFQEAQHYMQAKYKNPYYWAAFILIE